MNIPPTRSALWSASNRRVALLGAVWFILGSAPLASAKDTWDPVTPEERAATDCRFYPGASAEMTFVRQTLGATGGNEWTDHYRRIKIYSPKGAEELGVMNIEYSATQKVWNLAARVIKPNGAITEHDKNAFNETLAAKLGTAKVKRLTLAIPALEAGDILELKWSVSIESETNLYSWWYTQQNLPVRRFDFTVKSSLHDCRVLWFNSKNEAPKPAKRNDMRLQMSFLLPFEAEPYMPSERDVRSWFLLLYTERNLRWYSSEDVWKSLSTYYEEEFRLLTKPDFALKARAAELLTGADTDEEKLRRLYDFCQEHVANFDYFDSAELQQAKKRLEKDEHQTPHETLARKSGYSHHVNELFASLAKAAGYEVALARSASRHRTLNVKNENGWMFMNDDLACVRQGKAWQKYAPGDYFVTFGLLDTSNEGAPSLVCTEDKVVFDENAVAAADKSLVTRKGRFVLDADGNLEGVVEVTQTGHPATKGRQEWHGKQQKDIDDAYAEHVTRRLPAAEITDLAWENLSGSRLPAITRYKLKVPAYADVVGSKMIVPTNVFQHNAPALFTSETRQYPIYFDYAWSELDDIEIVLPEGYTLDAPSAPRDVSEPAGVIGASYRISYQTRSRTLAYQRNFSLGGKGQLAFQASSYRVLKKVCDGIKRSDEHTLVLKSGEPEATAADKN